MNTSAKKNVGYFNTPLKIVDKRPQYRKRLSELLADGIEKQVCRLAMRFQLSGETASKIADLIASEVEENSAHREKIRGISRVDAQSRWYARVYGAKSVVSKSFYDKNYGGAEQSLAEAIKWVGKTTIDMELPDYDVSCAIGSKQLENAERKAIVDKLLEKYGKCFILTGTGAIAANNARLMGQTGKTLNRIRHGKQNGFCLGYSRLRAEVNGFINEITPDIEKKIRLAVKERKPRWMSCEESENAVSSCMLSYASIDLLEVPEDYIEYLAGSVIKIARLRHYKKTPLSLDINGNVQDRRHSD
jgi:hypothetical protein